MTLETEGLADVVVEVMADLVGLVGVGLGGEVAREMMGLEVVVVLVVAVEGGMGTLAGVVVVVVGELDLVERMVVGTGMIDLGEGVVVGVGVGV